ncbi:MAG: hypothetical protein ACUVXJ_18620 [Phycisphaerae bacterium]
MGQNVTPGKDFRQRADRCTIPVPAQGTWAIQSELGMTNVGARMTNGSNASLAFVILISGFLGHSDFDIRALSLVVACPQSIARLRYGEIS